MFTLSACPATRDGAWISTSPFTDVFPRRQVEAKSVEELVVLLSRYAREVREAFAGGFQASVYAGKGQRKPKGFDAAKQHNLLQVIDIPENAAPIKVLHTILGTPVHV
jgi:hypothetical protein